MKPSGAYAKNVYNLAEGTVIAEDIISPKQAVLRAAANRQAEVDRGQDPPPLELDPNTYQNPLLFAWSDVTFLTMQLVVVGNGDEQTILQNLGRVIQYHVRICS
jgi:hypothetical protein